MRPTLNEDSSPKTIVRNSPHSAPPDIRDYLRVLRSRKLGIALVTGVVLGATLFFTFRQTPIYRAEARVLVKAPNSEFGAVPNLDTERQLIMSQVISEKARKDLRVATSTRELVRHLNVEVVPGTEVLSLTYDDVDPATAAKFANGFAEAYVDFRAEQALKEAQTSVAKTQRRLADVQRSLDSLNQEIQDAPQDQQVVLQSRRDTILAQLGVLQQRLFDLQSQASENRERTRIIQPAEVPTSPASPNSLRNGVFGLLAGLALALGFAFLRERLDDRTKSREDLERTVGAPVLAAIPNVEWWRKASEAQLVTWAYPKSPISEAYRTLAANVQYMASRERVKVLMITSSTKGEGKTTTAANLSLVLAASAKRVAVVSGDLRLPRIHSFYGLKNDVGLVTALAKSLNPLDVAKDPRYPNLRVICSGPIPQDPAALLGSRRAEEFFRSLRDSVDFVIIDTPPVLAVADASILAPLTDGVLFVTDARRSARSTILQARDQLATAGARIIGAVYNNFDPARSGYYSYYGHYYDYYGADESPENGQPRDRIWARTRRSTE